MVSGDYSKRLQRLAYVTIAVGSCGLLVSLYGRLQTGFFDHASVAACLGITLTGVLASMIAKILVQLGKRLNDLSAQIQQSKANPP
jgi:uncharacterized membrane protein YkvI